MTAVRPGSTTTVQENSASTEGGGIYNDTSETLNLHSSRVVFNNAPRGGGGGIFNDGTVNLINTTVRFNTLNNCSPVAWPCGPGWAASRRAPRAFCSTSASV